MPKETNLFIPYSQHFDPKKVNLPYETLGLIVDTNLNEFKA